MRCLKGAAPILLASFPILAGVEHSATIYEIVFVVVASVVIQGATLPVFARRSGLLDE